MMGPACGFNAQLVFYVVLQSHPSIGEIMNLPKGALLRGAVAGLLHYNNLLLTKGFLAGAYAVRLSVLQLCFLSCGSLVSFELT